MENWKDIIGYDGLYMASNLGNIKSISKRLSIGNGNYRVTKDKIIKQQLRKNGNGYFMITLGNMGSKKNFTVHRLIALAFIVNEENKSCVNHKNVIKTDNRIENLEWVSYSENGFHKSRILNKRHNIKITDIDSVKIREMFLSGLKQSFIANKFKISQSMVSAIILNKRRVHNTIK